MNKYKLIMDTWDLILQEKHKYFEVIGDPHRNYCFCTYATVVESYLSGKSFYNCYIDDITNEIYSEDKIVASNALYLILKNECNLCIKKETAERIIKIIDANRGEIYGI